MKLLLFSKTKASIIAAFVFFLFSGISSNTLSAQEDGEKLFKSYCASCHSPGTTKLVGPGLAGVYDKYERDWLYSWIKNSTALIENGDADAIAVFEENNKVLMPAQPVTNEQVDAILAYVKDFANAAPVVDNGGGVAGQTAQAEEEPTSVWLILGIIALFLILISILRRASHSINSVQAAKDGVEIEEQGSLFDALGDWVLGNKTIVGILGIVLIAMIAKVGWDAALGVGVYTGYEPEQPIKFSHKLHAGDNGIDCNYCHNSASYSKSAGIPSPNLCMNCHTYIQEGPEYGKEEIAKIYAALDFDPVTQSYGPNQKPIKWVKVHNLPDHVYFNHSQHVTVGKIACQKCHGPVETYTVGKQHESLTMGWCINCHKETKVQMTDNGYYDEIHKRLPEDLKAQYLEDGTITVAELGGIECAKCHY